MFRFFLFTIYKFTIYIFFSPSCRAEPRSGEVETSPGYH